MTEKLTLLTDIALGEGKEKKEDGLGFDVYAKVLADAAVGTGGPFTIGIYGEWGTGKTSLMRLIEADIKESRKEILTVWFNAWRFEGAEHPIIPLIASIVRAIEGNKSFRERLPGKGKAFLSALRTIANGFAVTGKLGVPGFTEVGITAKVKDMIPLTSGNDSLSAVNVYSKAYNTLENLQRENAKSARPLQIVIFIDDLDRCLPDRAIAVLESIKLVLAQPGFSFVLGVARSIVDGYIRHRYVTKYGLEDYGGHEYLDKIVQLPFPIPPHTGRVERLCRSVLERVPDEDQQAFDTVLPILAAAVDGNPRTTVRFVNNLLVDAAINRGLAKQPGTEEISIEYFALSRCLEQVWRNVYLLLTNSEELCGVVSKWVAWKSEESEVDSDGPRPQEGLPLDQPDDSRQSELWSALKGDDNLLKLLGSDEGRRWLDNPGPRKTAVQFLRDERDIGVGSPITLVYLDLPTRDSTLGRALGRVSLGSRDLDIDPAIEKEAIMAFFREESDPILLCISSTTPVALLQIFDAAVKDLYEQAPAALEQVGVVAISDSLGLRSGLPSLRRRPWFSLDAELDIDSISRNIARGFRRP